MRKFEDGRSVVGFPDFPTAHTDGADATEAMEEAIGCLGSVIAFAMPENWPYTGLFEMRQSANRNWRAA
jgi:predicted RNase H-like HicB family nuclease